MAKKTKLVKRLRKAIAALFSVSQWRIRIEYDDERQAYFFRLPKKRRFLKEQLDFDELILITNGGMVGVSGLNDTEESDKVDKLRGAEQEWEPIFQGYTVRNLQVPHSLPGRAERIELSRDEFYEITGEVAGEFPDYASKLSYLSGGAFPPQPEESGVEGGYSGFYIGFTPGEAVQSRDIHGADPSDGSDIRLQGCYDLGLRQITGGAGRGKYVAWLGINEAEKLKKSKRDVVSLQEWFLNGPRSYVCPRYTARTLEGVFRKRRIFLENEAVILTEPVRQSTKADFAFIQLAELAFVFQAVPESFGPPWSKNVGIEYRNAWGRIPGEHEREMVKEIISFVIGRPLLQVGYTEYDEQGCAVRQASTGPGLPSGYNLITLCQAGDTSPIDFQSTALEEALSLLIPPYLKLRDALNLNEALYRYWFAKIHPIGLDLPVFAAAVEGLSTAWHKSANAKVATSYMTEGDFSSTFKDEIAAFEQKLATVTYGERILNRVKGAHRMGSAEQVQHFFTDISLNIGKVEKTAMRSRNAMAHGSSSDYTDEKFDEVVRIRWAYQTLFERVMLKLLGYTGNYIDRSSEGWRQRGIDTLMEGTKKK